jgi:hypothetical protein
MVGRARATPDFLVVPGVHRAAEKPAAPSADRPAVHRRIEALVLALFWLLILEGALRKWVLPQFASLLFFIRDPVVLLIYWQALRAGVLRGAGPLLYVGLAFALLALPLALVQVTQLGDSQLLTVVIYGWRQYFLYLPLPFVIAATFTRQSLLRFARHACLAVILTAPLEFLQFHSPPAAVINRGIAADERLQFKSFAYTADLIRPSGTFTSTVGVTELVSSSFALLLAVWLTPARSRQLPRVLLVLGTAATAACLALSGSRSAFVHCGLALLCALLVGAVARQPALRNRALFLPLTVAGIIAVLYPIIFPEALSAMIERVNQAYATESQFSSLGIFGRALYETVDFVNFMTSAPLQGYALGLGGNGRTYFTHADPDLLMRIGAESDWSRHMVDLGPIVGLLFIVYRIAFTGILFGRVLKASRLADDAFPLLLFGYVGIGLFYGQLTGHGTVGGFLWLYLGLCMASCSTAAEAADQPIAPGAEAPHGTKELLHARWRLIE